MLVLFLAMIDDPDDQRFFEKMYYEYRGVVFAAANNVLKDGGLAEDATQETFVKAASIVETLKKSTEERRRAILISCARSRAYDILRKEKSSETIFTRKVEDSITNCRNENDIFLTLEVKGIYEQINLLPEKDRAIMMLYYVNEMKSAEIATELDMSGSAVRKRIERNTRKIAEICGGDR